MTNRVDDCFVCRKHRERGPLIPGGPVAEDDLVMVSHRTPTAPGSDGNPVYLGHLFVEPLRHAPGLADLTDAEAERVGWWCTHASRALRDVAGAVHVYAEVIRDAVPHSPYVMKSRECIRPQLWLGSYGRRSS